MEKRVAGVHRGLMADWVTISSLATAGGTLVLAVATFAAVRSSNRSARIAEIALQEQRRPLLAGSRLNVDPVQKIMFVDEHWVRVDGGYAVAESMDGSIYLVISLRNFGAGIGVCQGWAVRVGLQRTDVEHVPEDELRPSRATSTSQPVTWGSGRGRFASEATPLTKRSRARSPSRRRSWLSFCTQTRSARSGRSPGSRWVPIRRDARQETLRLISTARHWYLDRAGPR